MAHQISKSNGVTEMFSGSGLLPWWQGQDGREATLIKGLATWAQALELAHLNWRVKGFPVTVNACSQSKHGTRPCGRKSGRRRGSLQRNKPAPSGASSNGRSHDSDPVVQALNYCTRRRPVAHLGAASLLTPARCGPSVRHA
jgi:hypothetical protein